MNDGGAFQHFQRLAAMRHVILLLYWVGSAPRSVKKPIVDGPPRMPGRMARTRPLKMRNKSYQPVEEWSHGMILDRFKVPKGDEVYVSEAALRTTVTAIFEKMGVPPEDAAIGADVLVITDLRAVETFLRLQIGEESRREFVWMDKLGAKDIILHPAHADGCPNHCMIRVL